LSDLLVFGKRAGEYAAQFAGEHNAARTDDGEGDRVVRAALAPFARHGDESPYAIQYELQESMQALVGIVRREEEMRRALDTIAKLRTRAAAAGVTGNREYNPGWHTALDLPNLLTISEAIARAALERKESRGGHFRDDFPDKDPKYATFNITVRKGSDGAMQLERVPIPPMTEELKAVIESEK
jgi:succinate dehydrogenase / fumarate reductase flavoprotein subunit